MTHPDGEVEQDLARFTEDVRAALGPALACLALHGSAAGDDFVASRSDVNTVVVVARVTLGVLDALAPVVARWRPKGFAPPLVMDGEYLARARDSFPMELEDIRVRHRVLAGSDPFAALTIDRAALRTECEREARGKLLRLRTLYVEAASTAGHVERLMLDSLKTFLVVLRHLVRLRDGADPQTFSDTLARGEAMLGPLPVMRHLLGRRHGTPAAAGERTEFGAYLAEVERIVAAVDALDA